MSAGGAVGKRHKKRGGRKNKDKINLVFDETKRREFLTGFHKRNLERQRKKQAELLEKLKEERKRIKQEARDSYKKLVVSARPVPELETLFSNEFETDEATVKIVELSADKMSEKNNWIGRNKPRLAEEPDLSADSDEESDEELPGMGLTVKKIKNVEKPADVDALPNFASKKEIQQKIKKQATRSVKKSKAFQMKNKIEQLKNKKKSKREKNMRLKSGNKKNKDKKKTSRSKNSSKHKR